MANATIRVQFGSASADAAGGHLSAELDARPSGLNGGKTGFAAGETAYLLVFVSDNVSVTETVCSAGSLSAQGTTLVTVTDEVMFEDSDLATLSKPVYGALGSTTWYGRSLGTLSVQADQATVKSSVKGVGVAKVSYEARALIYALASPATLNGETDFTILALIKGAVT